MTSTQNPPSPQRLDGRQTRADLRLVLWRCEGFLIILWPTRLSAEKVLHVLKGDVTTTAVPDSVTSWHISKVTNVISIGRTMRLDCVKVKNICQPEALYKTQIKKWPWKWDKVEKRSEFLEKEIKLTTNIICASALCICRLTHRLTIQHGDSRTQDNNTAWRQQDTG